MLKLIKRFLVLCLVLAFLGVAALVAGYVYISRPNQYEPARMSIAEGTSVGQMAEMLARAGVIKSPIGFRAFTIAMGYSKKLRAGDYLFESGLSIRGVVQKLLTGDFEKFKITIPEGWTIKDIAEYLRNHLEFAGPPVADIFTGLASDPAFAASQGMAWPLQGLEGYLFPSTYEIYRLKNPEKLIRLMTGEFKTLFNEKILKGSGRVGLSPPQVVILASIVEKETGKGGERPLVASVFFNRLKAGMPLQSDPTVIYGLTDYDGNIKKSDLSNPHKYNTYVHPGLPLGPICNPGEASIDAVLNPAVGDYLYFVSRNDGTHQFSKTLQEHNDAVKKFQLTRRK